MQQITRDDRILGLALGIGDIIQPAPCMGYANACVCTDCTERQRLADERSARPAPRQPWEVRPPRKAAA